MSRSTTSATSTVLPALTSSATRATRPELSVACRQSAPPPTKVPAPQPSATPSGPPSRPTTEPTSPPASVPSPALVATLSGIRTVPSSWRSTSMAPMTSTVEPPSCFSSLSA
ncbi:hypothetical protein ACWEO4_43715 [Streptomyces sp. NPDC004393]